MIISKLQGGLGNQLFQWAYGKFMSIEYNTPLFLDTNSYSNQTNRGFSLDKFPFLKYSMICSGVIPAISSVIFALMSRINLTESKVLFIVSVFITGLSNHIFFDVFLSKGYGFSVN